MRPGRPLVRFLCSGAATAALAVPLLAVPATAATTPAASPAAIPAATPGQVPDVLPAPAAGTTRLQIGAFNDFHGRLEAPEETDDGAPIGGAAQLAGVFDAMRAKNPNTVVVSAGDNIGASTFTSFIQQDAPTIAALNAMGWPSRPPGTTSSTAGTPTSSTGSACRANRVRTGRTRSPRSPTSPRTC